MAMEKIRKCGKIKWIAIYDRIYKTHFYLCYGGEARDFVEFLANEHGKEILKELKLLQRAKGVRLTVEGGFNYLWIQKDNKEDATAVMIHELFHFVVHTLKDCGIKLNDNTEESYAYYIEYIYEEITKVFNKLIR